MAKHEAIKHEVIKHVGAIHISNTLSLLGRKVSNVLLLNAWNNLIDQEVHTISIRDLADAVGLDSNDLNVIKNALGTLVDTSLVWNVIGKDKKNVWSKSSILGSVQIVEGTGICSYTYPLHLRELLRNPNIFARINLLIQRQLDSKYSLALWEFASGELAVSKCGAGEQCTTDWIDLGKVHEILGSTDESYQEYKIFNQRILKPAISEINKISNLEIFNTESMREKRKITALRFSISPKDSYQLPPGTEIPSLLSEQTPALPLSVNDDKDNLVLSLMEQGFEEKVARGIVRGYSAERIAENLDWAVKQINSGRPVERPAGFITSAIRRDFVAPERVKRKKTVEVKQHEQSKQEREAIIEKIKGNFWLYKVNIVNQRLSELSEDEIELFDREMVEKNVFRTPERWAEYRREGITDKREHMPLRGLFYSFAMSRLLTDSEKDITVYARSQGVSDAIIRELQMRGE